MTTASLEALVDEARQQRPERAALAEARRAPPANAGARRRPAPSRPSASAAAWTTRARTRASFPREDAWRTSWDASVNVSWPLFDGGRARSEIAEAAALARATAGAARRVRRRRWPSKSASVSARSTRAAPRSTPPPTRVRSATEARRVVGERFAAGVATSTDVLDAQVALLQAELDRTQAMANAQLADAQDWRGPLGR